MAGRLKKHLLLIGFSCTGKTTLAKRVFEKDMILDSDGEVRRLVEINQGKEFKHIYRIYMELGHAKANQLIEQSEKDLINRWVTDRKKKVLSLGPGFPLRDNWKDLRCKNYVVLLRRSPDGIYEGFKKRRENTFNECPQAKDYDNWDVNVLVDDQRKEFPRDRAIMNIKGLLEERENFYEDNDEEIYTDDQDEAIQKLITVKEKLIS